MEQVTINSSSCTPMEQSSWLMNSVADDKLMDDKDLQMTSGHSIVNLNCTTDNEKTSGSIEIEAAVTFLTDIIKNSAFSKQSTDYFRGALTDLLKQHYAGHWYPNDPFKGSGYRCLRVNGVMNPLLTKAAQQSGLPLNKFRHAFPVELTVWVDPGDVSVRFGEEGSIGVYYAKSGSTGLQHDHQQMDDLRRLARQAQRRASTPPPIRLRSSGVAATPLLKPHRFSPPLTSSTAESPPSSHFIFSSHDGKCVRVNSQNLASYSSSNASPDFYQSPSRKYQAFAHGNQASSLASMDRRTPPLSANSFNCTQSSPFQQRQQQQQQHGVVVNHSPPRAYFGQPPQAGGGSFFGGADSPPKSGNGGPVVPFLESIDFESMRRTPVSFGQSQPGFLDLDSSPPSSNWWMGGSPQHQQQQQPIGGEYQFYSNAHLGSAYSNSQTAAAINQRRFGSGRIVDSMSVAS